MGRAQAGETRRQSPTTTSNVAIGLSPHGAPVDGLEWPRASAPHGEAAMARGEKKVEKKNKPKLTTAEKQKKKKEKAAAKK